MVRKVIVKNMNTGESVVLDCDDTTYLIDDGSINWGTVAVNHNTYEFPNQVGKNISSTNLDERDISISGYIIPDDFDYYGLTFKEIWDKSLISINEKKMLLARIFNPLDVVRLSVGKYYIEGKPNASISFGDSYSTNNEVMCQFLVPLFCSEPMFKYETTILTSIAGVVPKFHFPLVFKKNVSTGKEVGIIFGIVEGFKTIPVFNPGSIEIGVDFIIEALGEVINPKVINVTTGESFVIKKTMETKEKIIVRTYEGKRKVIGVKDSKEYNYFKYWTLDNKYLKIKPGKNLFSYDADDETWNLLDVKIEMRPEYFAFPDQ